MSKSGPSPRCIRINADLDERGHIVAYVKSTTRKGTTHAIVMDRVGHVLCDCEDARFRHNRYRPDIHDSTCCKHCSEFRDVLIAELEDRFPPSKKVA